MQEPESPEAERLRYGVMVAVVLLHLAAVPVAVAATCYRYGSQFYFGPGFEPKGAIWVSIAYAQASLLALYFAFGASRLHVRCAVFGVGLAYILASVMCANLAITDVSMPPNAWFGTGVSTSRWLHLPAVMAGLALLPIRWLIGSVQLRPPVASRTFGIVDLLVITTFAAALLAWFRLVMHRGFFDTISLTVTTAATIACLLSCLQCVLGRRWWSIGAIAFTITITARRLYSLDSRYGDYASWYQLLIPWLIVLATLACYRLLGYRLQRPDKIPSSAT